MPPERALTTVHKLRRLGTRRDPLPRERPASRLPPEPVLALGARGRAARREHRLARLVERPRAPRAGELRDDPGRARRRLASSARSAASAGGSRSTRSASSAERGYVVTFRQVDPLYTVDLSSPERPRVAGELKIRGYSAYLHPLADDLLLGVGQDATERRRHARNPALALRRFRSGAAGAALPARDRRRVERGRVGSPRLPVLGAAEARRAAAHELRARATARSAAPPASTVDRAAGIAEAGRAEHSADVRRSLVLDGQLFTISDAGIEANSMPGLAEQAHLAFP